LAIAGRNPVSLYEYLLFEVSQLEFEDEADYAGLLKYFADNAKLNGIELDGEFDRSRDGSSQ